MEKKYQLRGGRKVTIRRAREEDLPLIRQLVRDGLHELIPLMYRKELFPSALVQVPTCLVAFCASALTNTTNCINVILTFALAYAVTTYILYFIVVTFLKYNLPVMRVEDLCDSDSFKSTFLKKKQCNFWVAETEAYREERPEIIATVGVEAMQDKLQKLMSPEDVCHSLELRRMSIRKDYRGTGLAQRLVDTVNKHAAATTFDENSPVKYIVLARTEFQPAAQKFYKKEGFKQIGSVPEKVFNGRLTMVISWEELSLNAN